MKKLLKIWFICLLSVVFIDPEIISAKMSFLKVKGQHIVDENNKKVFLGGFNLGNWLLVEPWMLQLDGYKGFKSGMDIFNLLEKRFGKKKSLELYKIYVDSYITEKDIKYLADLGVNYLRVPFWFRAVIDKNYTPKKFYYLDKVIKWCEKYKIYVMLDLHGAPGGQSEHHNILGEQQSNKLWDTQKYIDQTLKLWQDLAKRYKNKSVIAGYDILNEAMGAPSYTELISMYDRIYKAIRKIDKKHIIIIEDAVKGLYRLPEPSKLGWKNIVYSFHFYPMFGGPDDMDRIVHTQQVALPGLKAAQDYFNVPINVGECNSMQMTKGGVPFLYRYLEIFREYDWSFNIWSYKRISDTENDMWGFVGYQDDWTYPDFNTISFKQAKEFFKSFHFNKVKKKPFYEFMIKKYFKDIKRYKYPQYSTEKLIKLVPQNGFLLRSRMDKGIRVEWDREIKNYGWWDKNDAVLWKINIQKEQVYKVILDYATGSDNAVISLIIDHYHYMNIKLKKTLGNWAGYSKGLIGYVKLKKGTHYIKVLGKSPQGGIMNLRSVELHSSAEDKDLLQPSFQEKIVLSSFDLYNLDRKQSLCVEWQNNPPNVGYFSDGESFSYKIDSMVESDYSISFKFSTPNPGAGFIIYVNNKRHKKVMLPNTKAWHAYQLINAGVIHLKKGKNIIRFQVISKFPENTGNINYIYLNKR